MRSVVSLYCLDSADDYLGCSEVEQVGLSWLGFETITAGTLFLSRRRLLFEQRNAQSSRAAILTFQLTDVDNVELDSNHTANLILSFRTACHTEATTRPDDPLVGPWIPFQRSVSWRFRCSRATTEWRASLEAMIDGAVEKRLQWQERQIQSSYPSCACFPVKRVTPLREQRGVLLIKADEIVFVPLFPLGSAGTLLTHVEAVSFLFPRWVLFEDTGLDFYATPANVHGTPRALARCVPLLSLVFFSPGEKREAIRALARLAGLRPLDVSITELTRAWQMRELSNYEYLASLNLLASRSRLDLYQYPVFPWVLKDYSADLDIQHPSAYRDLSKPIGALSALRLEQLRTRAAELAEVGQPFCLYTSHYSSAWAVSYYLVRPHPEYQFCLQSGHLDNADRLFESLEATWRNVNRGSSDFKELIPEFFDDAFLQLAAAPAPARNLSLGVKQDGLAVRPAVLLPATPSANSPLSFLRLHQAALESDYVSSTIHLWIDLIFGIKQDGEDANLVANVFHPYCYPQTTAGSANVDRQAYAREFGNVPMKLFASLHPGRNSYTSDARQTEYTRCVTQSPITQLPPLQLNDSGDDDDTSGDALPTLVPYNDSDAPSTPRGSSPDGSDRVVALSQLPSAATLSATSHLSTFVQSTQSVVLSVFSAADEAASEPCLRVTLVESGGESIFIYDCLSGERLRCFSDFEAPIVRAHGYCELVFLFTMSGALYLLDVSACTVIGHIETFSCGSPIRVCCCTPSFWVFADTDSRVTAWRVHDKGQVEAVLSTRPFLDLEASAVILCLCARDDHLLTDGFGDMLHVAMCTDSQELIQCSGANTESYSSYPLPFAESASTMVFSSEANIVVLFPGGIVTLNAFDGAVIQQFLLSHQSVGLHCAAPLPLLYDGPDYLLSLENTDEDQVRPLILIRDGFVVGHVAQASHNAPSISPTRIVASAEYFVASFGHHAGDIFISSIDTA